MKLGGIWRSTWPGSGGGGGTGDSTKSWSIYGNTVTTNPFIGPKNNFSFNIQANSKLLLQVNPDSTVNVKTRILPADSSEQAATTKWVKKDVEKILLFDSTFDTTQVNAKTIALHVNTSKMASITYVNSLFNSVTSFDGWALTGNNGTDTAVNFIGNIDNTSLKFKVNNTLAGMLDADFLNTFFGLKACFSCATTGAATEITAIGNNALYFNTIGYNNTAVGYNSLGNNTIGSSNTAVGVNSLMNNVSGYNNTAIGIDAGVLETTLVNATAIGANAKVGISDAVSIGDTATNTNVGIGTAYPESKLHVKGGVICNSARIGDDWFFTKKITLTPSDVYSGNSTPILAIDAPTSDYAIDVISTSVYMQFNSTPYVNSAAIKLNYNTGTDYYTNELFDVSAGASTGIKLIALAKGSTFLTETPIYIQFSADNVSGDSNVNVYIYYRLVKI